MEDAPNEQSRYVFEAEPVQCPATVGRGGKAIFENNLAAKEM